MAQTKSTTQNIKRGASKPKRPTSGSPKTQAFFMPPSIETAQNVKIAVSGYKSISDEQEIEIKPLTLIAGANSAGKSSMMQPFLLLKQTLEDTADAGAIRLQGGNVKFTEVSQLLWRNPDGGDSDSFAVKMSYDDYSLSLEYRKKGESRGFDVSEMTHSYKRESVKLMPEMTSGQIREGLGKSLQRLEEIFNSTVAGNEWVVVRNRCFLGVGISLSAKSNDASIFLPRAIFSEALLPFVGRLSSDLLRIIHLPGLRGNPKRTYDVSAVGVTFPGTFENYAASIIAQWQEESSPKINDVCEDLKTLSLTSQIRTKRLNDAEVEIQVGRMPVGFAGKGDDQFVNITDVGFGMSQTLPVIVALHAARPGQIVYLEQPEIHLHPCAQVAMATVLARAANRGVRVVAETHSSLLLTGVQTLIAEGNIASEKVCLHWFDRSSGQTKITTANPDAAGRFGDWPVDFDDVSLDAEGRYLDAAQAAKAQMANRKETPGQ